MLFGQIAAVFGIVITGVWGATQWTAAALGHQVRLGSPWFAVAYHQTAAALSAFSKTGLTDIADIVPWIVFMVSEGWWMTGQTILVNGGYTTK